MKKILIVLIALLCLNSFIFKKDISAQTVYTQEDLKVDYIYHFKAGDVFKWSDDSCFDIYARDFDYDTLYINKEGINSYVFEDDIDLIAYRYAYGTDEHFVTFHRTVNVTFDMCGKGENLVRQSKLYSTGVWAYKPDVPTYDGYIFAGWYLSTDFDSEDPIKWDDWGEYEIVDRKDITFYANWKKAELKCIEVDGTDQANPQEEVKIQIIPIAENDRPINISLLQEDERPIIYGKLENDPSEPFIIEYDEENDGYFYTYSLDNIEKEYKFMFWIKDNWTINSEYVVNSLYVDCNEVLDNHGYPWADNFTNNEENNSLNLNTKLIVDSDKISYQWQASRNNADYYDIPGANQSSHKIRDSYLQFSWYRCEVKYVVDGQSYTALTKPINIIDPTKFINISEENMFDENDDNTYIYHSLYSERNIENILQGLYVGNGKIFYCLGDNNHPQFYNIISKYNNGLHDYYISSAYDESWTIYMKNSNDNSFINENNIDSIRFVFNEDTPEIIDINIKLKDKCDMAIYTDLCLASNPDIYYADISATKALLNSDMSLKEIQMTTYINFADANLQDNAGMLLRPITPASTYTIDTFLNGPYYNEDRVKYEYIVNDYNNEQNLTYEQIFNILNPTIFNYNHGVNHQAVENDPFVYYKKANGEKIVIGMYCKDNVMALSWKNVDTVKFKFGLSNSIKLGITHDDVTDIIEETKHDDAPKEKELPFVIPKTCIN